MTTPATVYATHTGTAFHAAPDCRALLAGQLTQDEHRVFWLGRNAGRTLHQPKPLAVGEAWSSRRTPCTTCLPDAAAAFRLEPSTEDYGHRPAIGLVDGRALGQTCHRCFTVDPNGPRYFGSRQRSVRWPCTSAIVLGLAPRATA
jgi:hypothetical protein